jgi:hypothetical protein
LTVPGALHIAGLSQTNGECLAGKLRGAVLYGILIRKGNEKMGGGRVDYQRQL